MCTLSRRSTSNGYCEFVDMPHTICHDLIVCLLAPSTNADCVAQLCAGATNRGPVLQHLRRSELVHQCQGEMCGLLWMRLAIGTFAGLLAWSACLPQFPSFLDVTGQIMEANLLPYANDWDTFMCRTAHETIIAYFVPSIVSRLLDLCRRLTLWCNTLILRDNTTQCYCKRRDALTTVQFFRGVDPSK